MTDAIIVRGDPALNEGTAAGGAYPGHLLNHNGEGALEKSRGNAAQARFALPTSPHYSMSQPQPAGDLQKYGVFGDGDVAFAFCSTGLTEADGEVSVSEGDAFVDGGDGSVVPEGNGSGGEVIGYADEDFTIDHQQTRHKIEVR